MPHNRFSATRRQAIAADNDDKALEAIWYYNSQLSSQHRAQGYGATGPLRASVGSNSPIRM